MKFLLLIHILILSGITAFAQKGSVNNAYRQLENGNLEKAIKAINQATDTTSRKAAKSVDWPRSWVVKGEILQAIYKSGSKDLKSKYKDQLSLAYGAYQKAITIDKKNKYSRSIAVHLNLLVNDLSGQASQAYEEKNFQLSLQSFEKIIAINNLEIIKTDNTEVLDTLIFFNAGLSAFHSQQYEKAILYYTKAAEYGFNGADTHLLIAKTHEKRNDTLQVLETLEKALQLYPENEDILNSITAFYVKLNKPEEALSYLQKVIKQDPTNPGYYYARGTLYEKMHQIEKATEMYLEAIKMDSLYFNANYNLGTLYYNKGVEQINKASLIPANENIQYKAEIKLANEWFEKSLPFVEKCLAVQQNNPAVLESLKNLYYRLKKLDRYNAVVYKLENLGIS